MSRNFGDASVRGAVGAGTDLAAIVREHAGELFGNVSAAVVAVWHVSYRRTGAGTVNFALGK